MRYLKWFWIHNQIGDEFPILYYMEIGDDMMEKRRAEIYPDGRIHLISEELQNDENFLSSEPFSDTKTEEGEENNTESEISKVFEMSRNEFEKIWKKLHLRQQSIECT